MTYRVTFEHGDLDGLDEQRVRLVAFALAAIRINPYDPPGYRHKVLEHQPKMGGNLAGLHSVAINNGVYEESLRIVYRVVDDLVEVIAIGTRTGSAVFKLARDRIGARPKPRPMRTAYMDAVPRSKRRP